MSRDPLEYTATPLYWQVGGGWLVPFAGLQSNLYQYTGNNPLLRVDPTGEFWHIVIGGGIGGVIGGINAAFNCKAKCKGRAPSCYRHCVIGGAIAGGIGGAIGAATLNPTLAVTGSGFAGGVLAGAIAGGAGGLGGGLAGEVADSVIGEQFSPGDVAASCIGGAIAGGVACSFVPPAVTGELDDVTAGVFGASTEICGLAGQRLGDEFDELAQ